jgi:hypothetical protein
LKLARAASGQLEQHEIISDRDTELVVVPRTHSARARHARQWHESEAGWLPCRWETLRIEYEPEVSNVRWLLYAVELVVGFFERRNERLLEWVRDTAETELGLSVPQRGNLFKDWHLGLIALAVQRRHSLNASVDLTG